MTAAGTRTEESQWADISSACIRVEGNRKDPGGERRKQNTRQEPASPGGRGVSSHQHVLLQVQGRKDQTRMSQKSHAGHCEETAVPAGHLLLGAEQRPAPSAGGTLWGYSSEEFFIVCFAAGDVF